MTHMNVSLWSVFVQLSTVRLGRAWQKIQHSLFHQLKEETLQTSAELSLNTFILVFGNLDLISRSDGY